MSDIGIDLVHVPTFAEKMKSEAAVRRLFTERELSETGGSIETLAGMFAAKEAYFKALHKTPEWHAVEIEHKESGAPVLCTDPHAQVSISHDGEHAVAVVLVSEQ